MMDQGMLAGLPDLLALAGGVSTRKLDLFNCWCCQALRPYLTDRRSIAAARYADRHVDEGWPDTDERLSILQAARAAVHELAAWANKATTTAELRKRRVYALAAQVAADAVGNDQPNRGVLSNAKLTTYAFGWANDDLSGPGGDEKRDSLRAEHLRLQSAVVRDLVGEPLRPIEFDLRWRTADVVGVARAIYDEKAFIRLPILADALMDAGCDIEEVISHCRREGPHVRGCWVVDLALAKE